MDAEEKMMYEGGRKEGKGRVLRDERIEASNRRGTAVVRRVRVKGEG